MPAAALQPLDVRSIRAGIGRRVLEVGPGIGNMSHCCWGRHARAEHISGTTCSAWRQFGKSDSVHAPSDLNAIDVEHYRPPRRHGRCPNVPEHVEHDECVLRGIFELLALGGRLLLLVPALPQLYGKIDQALSTSALRAAGPAGPARADRFCRRGPATTISWACLVGSSTRVLRRDAIPTFQTAPYDASYRWPGSRTASGCRWACR
jgi:hypothetical protein